MSKLAVINLTTLVGTWHNKRYTLILPEFRIDSDKIAMKNCMFGPSCLVDEYGYGSGHVCSLPLVMNEILRPPQSAAVIIIGASADNSTRS